MPIHETCCNFVDFEDTNNDTYLRNICKKKKNKKEEERAKRLEVVFLPSNCE